MQSQLLDSSPSRSFTPSNSIKVLLPYDGLTASSEFYTNTCKLDPLLSKQWSQLFYQHPLFWFSIAAFKKKLTDLTNSKHLLSFSWFGGGWSEPGGSSVPCGVTVIRRQCNRMAGSGCWLSAREWTRPTQVSSMWSIYLLGLLTVWPLGAKRKHSNHLEAEATALLRHSLGSSTVKTSTTFYWSKLKLAQIKRMGKKKKNCTIFNRPNPSSFF